MPMTLSVALELVVSREEGVAKAVPLIAKIAVPETKKPPIGRLYWLGLLRASIKRGLLGKA